MDKTKERKLHVIEYSLGRNHLSIDVGRKIRTFCTMLSITLKS